MRRRRPPGVPVKLADAVAEVTADYLGFLRASRTQEPEDAKAFAARHAAAKAALAHIEQILKLASGSEEEAADLVTETQSLLTQARRQMDLDRATERGQEGDGEAG
jgi:hypothetical protein